MDTIKEEYWNAYVVLAWGFRDQAIKFYMKQNKPNNEEII